MEISNLPEIFANIRKAYVAKIRVGQINHIINAESEANRKERKLARLKMKIMAPKTMNYPSKELRKQKIRSALGLKN